MADWTKQGGKPDTGHWLDLADVYRRRQQEGLDAQIAALGDALNQHNAVAGRDQAATTRALTGDPARLGMHLQSSQDAPHMQDVLAAIGSGLYGAAKAGDYHNALPKILSGGAALIDMPLDLGGYAIDKLAGHTVTPEAGHFGSLAEAGWRGLLGDLTGDQGYQTPVQYAGDAERVGGMAADMALGNAPFMGAQSAASLTGAGQHLADTYARPAAAALADSRAAATAPLKAYASQLYDQAIPARNFLPFEVATSPDKLTTRGRPYAGNSTRTHVQDEVAQNAMEGIPVDFNNPAMLRGQGAWAGEYNPLYAAELPSYTNPAEMAAWSRRVGARSGQQAAVAPYSISAPLYGLGADSALFNRPSRADIVALTKQFGDQAIIADNPHLNGLVVRNPEGYGNLDPNVAEQIRQVLGGRPPTPVKIEGQYLDRSSYPIQQPDGQAASLADWGDAFPALQLGGR